VTRSTLCGACRPAWLAWLDYRLPPVLSISYGSGAAYDATPQGIRDRQASRFREWRDTIRWQQAHIEALCAAGNHGPTGTSSASPSPSS
jgi:hypothetical protein